MQETEETYKRMKGHILEKNMLESSCLILSQMLQMFVKNQTHVILLMVTFHFGKQVYITKSSQDSQLLLRMARDLNRV